MRILLYCILFLQICRPLLIAGGAVAIDQAGYAPATAKYVFVSVPADSFFIVEAASGVSRFRGALTIWNSKDPSTGLTVRRGDFSSFRQPGLYRIVTSQNDSSARFEISDTVWSPAYRKALKGYYFQRCGTALVSPFAGAYIHGKCHQADGFLHPSTGSSGFRSAVGGWHDAGDYGKYVVNAGVTVGTLLMAYELFPARFAQDDMAIPESGNGIPDILDEVRYELEWLLKMQRADGGVYAKLTREQFEGFVMPENDSGTRYLYEVSSTATGDFAAMLARAARVYRRFDGAFADTCLALARNAWSFLDANPFIVPVGGFHNPAGTATGEYGDGDDSDERLWAAAELYQTTGDSAYHSAFLANYASSGLINGAMSWQNVRTMAQFAYLRGTQPGTSSAVRTQLRQSLNSFCQSLVTKRNSSGFQVVLGPSDYYWGSNSVALNAAVCLIIGYLESGNQTFADVAADQLHYILGVNGLARSFLAGVGTVSPRQPHHRPSASDGIPDPVPGLLCGGPNHNVNDDPVLKALSTSSTPPALCYVDSTPSYASNEIAINWNAPLVFVSGYFAGEQGTSDVKSQVPNHNSMMLLGQNSPNPFNGSTRIPFVLPRHDDVELTVTRRMMLTR
jgi:endoglucanase